MTVLFDIPTHPRVNDPHVAPSSSELDHQYSPILYLPPLLSSLPNSKTSTHLPDIDPVSLSLHKALHHFKPVDEHYAARGYEEAFNWDEIGQMMVNADSEEEREWYIVAFRSRRKEGSDSGREFTHGLDTTNT
jgi:hypothetical protein